MLVYYICTRRKQYSSFVTFRGLSVSHGVCEKIIENLFGDTSGVIGKSVTLVFNCTC